jgi:aminopeptidase N
MKIRRLISGVLFMLFVLNVFKAQDLPEYLLHENQAFDKKGYEERISKNIRYYPYDKQKPSVQNTFIPIKKKPYDVLSYNLYMDWYNLLNHQGTIKDGAEYEGVNKIKIVLNSDDLYSVVFDAIDLAILSVSVDGIFISPVPQQVTGELSIPLPNYYKKGDTLDIDINYKYNSDKQGGIFLYVKGEPVDIGPPPARDTVRIEERIAYTMSEPVDARLWMPCNDQPDDKALATITVKVPYEYMAASNGILEERIDVQDSNYIIFKWRSKYPIATYLMHVAASKFHYYYDWYHRVSNPDDSIKIEYYVWERDYLDTSSDGLNYNATYAFRNSVEMMEYFSTIFGEYPYDKYGMVAVQNAWFGGMEHQTITTLTRNVLRKINRWGGNSDWSNQIVIAHELAHQWLGDLMTCASWNDIWVNEGGAVWSEALWSGRNNRNSYYSSIMGKRSNYLWYDSRQTQPPIYAPPIYNVFNYPTTYAKAGWVYHMLSEITGRENFLGLLRQMLSEYSFRSIDTEEFKKFLKSVMGNPMIDLDKFFDQWLYHAGHPKYVVEMEPKAIPNTNEYDVRVTLWQVQEGFEVPETFHVPLWMTFYGPDGMMVYDSLVNTSRKETFHFSMDFMPDSVKLDTTRTLCEDVTNYTTVSINENISFDSHGLIHPNPLNRGMIGHFDVSIEESSDVEINLYDILGNPIKNIYKGYLKSGVYDFKIPTNELVAGVYTVILKTNLGLLNKKLIICN